MKYFKILLILSLVFNGYLFKKFQELRQSFNSIEAKSKELAYGTPVEVSDSISQRISALEKKQLVKDTVSISESAVNRSPAIVEDIRPEEAIHRLDADPGLGSINDTIAQFELDIEQFFISDLSLSFKNFKVYNQIKEKFFSSKNKIHEKFSPKNKNTEGFYLQSNTEIIAHNEVLKKNLDKLKKILGEESFNKYQQYITDYNNLIAKNTPKGEPFFFIEF
jgi:hypothetical protein